MRDRRSIVAAAFIAAVGVALAGQADDPRGDQACLAVHGARLPFGVRTVEDVIARRGRARPAFHCSLQAPFGRFVNVIGSSQPWFYLEIPKAGSTSMKRWTRGVQASTTISKVIATRPLAFVRNIQNMGKSSEKSQSSGIL